MAPKKVRLPQYSHKGPIPGPEMVRRAGLKDALAQHEGQSAGGRVASRFFHNIGADAMSDVHSLDPRTKSGAINLMAIFAGGKGGEGGMSRSQMADAAMEQHLGHSEFRPYHAAPRTPEGYIATPDQFTHGGMHPQGDYGFHLHNTSPASFQEVHGYTLPELLGLIQSERILSPQRIARFNKKSPGAGFLHEPYKNVRNQMG